MSDPILEIGAAGLDTSDEKVKSLMTRIINTETPGFKTSDVTIRSFPLELEEAQNRFNSQKPEVEGTYYNHIQGALVRTGKQTDMAMGIPGFFVVACPWGEGYTRDGRFTINKDGNLVSSVGNYPLLGQNGPISIPASANVSIAETGEIRADAEYVDKIRTVDFQDKQALQSVNGVIFRDLNSNMIPSAISNPRIVQGFVEASNASIIDQMMDMITISRIYDFNTKIISTRDSMMTSAIELGKNQ